MPNYHSLKENAFSVLLYDYLVGRYFFSKSLGKKLSWPAKGWVFLLALAIGSFVANTDSLAKSGKQANGSKNPKIELAQEVEKKIIHYTNKERQSRGLKPVRPANALKYIASQHSENMCASGKFQHESSKFPNGWKTVPGRFKRIGVHAGAENIGYRTLRGKPDKWAKKMVEGWMKSKGHRKNILDPKFKYIGVGLRPCKDLGYTTQVFSTDPGEKH